MMSLYHGAQTHPLVFHGSLLHLLPRNKEFPKESPPPDCSPPPSLITMVKAPMLAGDRTPGEFLGRWPQLLEIAGRYELHVWQKEKKKKKQRDHMEKPEAGA